VGKTNREGILDVAEQQFSERGFDATSLGDIADQVGVRSPSLYKHFTNKDEMFVAVLERLLDPYFDILHRILDVPMDQDQAEKNLHTVLRFYFASPNLARLLQHVALAGGAYANLVEERWFIPFFERAAALSVTNPYMKGRDPHELMLLVIAFHNMIVGYITLSPLTEKLIGGDPLSRDAIKRQEAFMLNLARSFWQEHTTSPA
jgi:AcrR family transcriptional regulator